MNKFFTVIKGRLLHIILSLLVVGKNSAKVIPT